MTTFIKFISFCLFTMMFATCSSSEVVQPQIPIKTQQTEYTSGNAENRLNLDTAIAEVATYFVQRLSNGAKIALVLFDTPTGRLSDYVFEEMWGRITALC